MLLPFLPFMLIVGVCAGVCGRAQAQSEPITLLEDLKRVEAARNSGTPTPGPDGVKAKAEAMALRAEAYLRGVQDACGGWAVNAKGPTFPAISGLVLQGMLLKPGSSEKDAAIAAGLAFVISKQQEDGGIYDQILPSYNTAICASALAKVGTPEAKAAVKKALAFLRSIQYGEGAVSHEGLGESATPVDKDHPFYGGVGYGKHGRPDLSNTSFWVEALRDCGVEPGDAAFQRAVVFLQRTQMLEAAGGMKVNEMEYAKGSQQGGFIYSTSVNKDDRGGGQSNAPTFEETLSDGTTASRLRSYGSMTYAGFKSYLYAGLKKDDPRVVAARGWIAANYTLEENPGVGTDGMYFYMLVFAKAMDAFGEPSIEVKTAGGAAEVRDWKADLVTRLAGLQNEDGSFRSIDDRWMENNPVLITAYALIALREAAQ